MATNKTLETPTTLSFEKFWSWLQGHPNCILRAGTPETVLYDDEDLHWHFTTEGPETQVVQVLRGKRLVGEILIYPADVAYVLSEAGEEDQEWVFELISESEADRISAYHFVLSHSYEGGEERPTPGGRAIH